MVFINQNEDNINVSTLFNRIHSSTPPLVKILLLFKYSTSQTSYFYFLVFFLKFYGPLIITSNFNYNSSSSNTSIIKLTNILRKMTFTEFYSNSTSSAIIYYAISSFIFFIELSLLIYIGTLYVKIKKDSHKHNVDDNSARQFKLNIFGIIMFYVNVLLNQHIIEHCAIIYYIYFIQNGYLKGNEMYLNSNSYNYYIKSSIYTNITNDFINIIFMIINALTLIFINLFSILGIHVINTPIIPSKSMIKIRNKTIYIIIFVFQHMILFHPLEIYLKGIVLKIYLITIYIIIIISICIVFTSNLNYFEYNTNLFPFMVFWLLYIFISSLIEIIVFVGNYVIQTMEICYLIVIKLFISFVFLLLYYLYKDMIFVKGCEHSIFNIYYGLGDSQKIDFESFFYLLEKLFIFNKAKSEKDKDCLCAILSAILFHIKTCQIEYCKCKHLILIPQKYQKKEIFKIILLKRIGFIIETSFIRINYTLRNNFELTLLLSEYFFLIKKNYFMAYSILHSYFLVNLHKMNFQELITFYTLHENYVKEIEKLIAKEKKFVKFTDVINDENISNKFNNMMIKYCSNYIDIINIKEAIESTCTIEYYNNSTVIKRITSKNLNNKNLTHFIRYFSNQYKLYHIIKSKSKKFTYSVRTLVYYFKIFLFFDLFDGKIPKTILRNFSCVSEQKRTLYGLPFIEAIETFECYLNDYFSKNKSKKHIIILDCNKGLQIKTFSIELANNLNFQHKSLIGENFERIFPTFFKIIHTKAMLSYLIQNRNYFYMVRKTYIFTFNNAALPCIIKSAIFPQFSKNLLIIIEISLIEEKDHFCFMLNQYYETISISKTLEDNLDMNLELLKKCHINLIDIFDITHNYLDKHFSQFKNQASSKAMILNFNTKEILGSFFYLNNRNFGDNNNILSAGKTTNIHNSFEQKENFSYNLRNINFELYAKSNKLFKIKHKHFLKRKRSTVLSNLLRIIHNSSELELKDDIKFKFGEIYKKYKQTFNNLEMSNRNNEIYYIINIKSILVYNSPLFLVEIKLKEKYTTFHTKLASKTINNNKFEKVKIDTLVVSKDRDDDKQLENKDRDETPLEKDHNESNKSFKNIHRNFTFGGNNINNNIDLTPNTFSNSLIIRRSSFFNKQKSFLISSSDISPTKTKMTACKNIQQNQNNQSKIRNITVNNHFHQISNIRNTLSHISNIEDKNNNILCKSNIKNNSNIISQKKEKRQQYESSLFKKKYRKIKIINLHVIIQIIVHLSICFIIIAYILISQFYFFSKIDVLIKCVFSTFLLRDKFMNLQSSIYNLIYIFSGVSEEKYNINIYYSHSLNLTSEFEETYTLFFQHYNKYSNIANKNYEETIKLFNYTKLITSWQPINYTNDFSGEIYYLIYMTNSFLDKTDTIENIQKDVNMLFNLEYLNHFNESLNSKVAPLLYYIINNCNLLSTNIISKISNLLRNETDDFSTNFSMNNFIWEAVYILNFSCLFILLLCLLHKYNGQIFNMIISILDVNPLNINQSDELNNTISSTFPFINVQNSQNLKPNINNFIKQKLKNFSSLLGNFTKDNYIMFQTKNNLNIAERKNASSQLLNTEFSKKKNISSNISNVHSKKTSNTVSTSSKLPAGSNSSNIPLLNRHYVTQENSVISNKIDSRSSNETTTQLTNSSNISTLNNDHIQSQKNNYLNYFKKQKMRMFTILIIIIIIIYVMSLCFSVLRLLFTVQYTKDVKLIEDLFLFLSGKFTLVTTIFNTIRKILYTDISFFNLFKDYESWTNILEEQSDYVNLNLNFFPLSKELWSQMKLKLDDPNYNIDILCNNDPYCKNVLEEENGNNYCNKGIEMGIKAIIHKFEQIIQELGQLNNTIGLNEIKKYWQKIKMNGIEITIEFVISQIQINLYKKYDNDCNNLRTLKEKSLILLYSVTFIVGTGVIFTVIIYNFLKIKNLFQVTSFGTYKIKLLSEHLFL